MKWAAMKVSRKATWRPFPPSRGTSARVATSPGMTPSTFFGTPSQETCPGPAWCLDSLYKPRGTGAPIRSVKWQVAWLRTYPWSLKKKKKSWWVTYCLISPFRDSGSYNGQLITLSGYRAHERFKSSLISIVLAKQNWRGHFPGYCVLSRIVIHALDFYLLFSVEPND